MCQIWSAVYALTQCDKVSTFNWIGKKPVAKKLEQDICCDLVFMGKLQSLGTCWKNYETVYIFELYIYLYNII